jgi:acyl-coenzyme A synthetase/AMP-(fatty) acid ligase
MFASTECAFLLITGNGQDALSRLFRTIPGVSYEFRPVVPDTKSESGHQPSTRLLELVVLADSGDCPDGSLRQADGHFHTGDLFEEITPGHYASRGRDDDWIKSENSLRCDTKFVSISVVFKR